MPKRKRSSEDELAAKLAEYRQELFRALKAAKGFERQRLSKRIHAEQAQDKIQRLEREIAVLKSLDLQQTAQAHLASSLTKFKTIAEHPAVPDDVKHGAPRPDLTEEERTALHNVTSGLYNRQNVRDVIEKAIRGVCLTLEVPIPEKKGKQKKGDKNGSTSTNTDAEEVPAKKRRVEDSPAAADGDRGAFSTDSFEGFSDAGASDDEGTDGDEEDNSGFDEGLDEETAVERFASRLGGSDDGDSDEEDASALRAKYAALLNMTGDASSDDSQDELEDVDLDMADLGESGSGSEDSGDASDTVAASPPTKPRREALPSPSPPPPSTHKSKEKKPAKTGDTTFLPTLMGGYFSGSESASDVDVAPRKKRLGQRQRQAMAEKKHGEKANHVRKQATQQKKGRDSGWDVRRGAVDPDDPGKSRHPWKKGVSNPLAGGARGRNEASRQQQGGGRADRPRPAGKPKPKSRDDQGQLHPSWEAKKKAKEAVPAAFQGTKITF